MGSRLSLNVGYYRNADGTYREIVGLTNTDTALLAQARQARDEAVAANAEAQETLEAVRQEIENLNQRIAELLDADNIQY